MTPAAYTRQANFVTYAVNHTAVPYNPADHDLEFNVIYQALLQTQTVVNGVTRTDGKLANSSVGLDTLTSQLLSLFLGKNLNLTVKGAWAGLALYAIGDIVTNGGGTYVSVASQYASSSFATDLANGSWAVLNYPQGTAGGSATLDGSSLIPMEQIPTLSLAKIPLLDFTKLPALTAIIRSQTNVDFGSTINNSTSVTIAVAGVTLMTPVNASMDSKVGDTIGDETQTDGFAVTAKCLTNGFITINVVCLTGFALGQYTVNYDYIKTLP